MNTCTFRNNNIFASQPWFAAVLLKEAKKRLGETQNFASVRKQEQSAFVAQAALKTRVVFTKEDAGKSQEDIHKIQQIHAELDTLPLVSRLAFY